MSFHQIPLTDDRYALISFDRQGSELRADPDGVNGRMTERLLQTIQQEPPTDIFLFSHGWKGDLPAAVDQYNRWFKALLDRVGDIQRFRSASSGFTPMFIGLHWPSLPWGDDELGPVGSFTAADGVAMDELKERYLDRLGDSAEIRKALDTIFEEARVNAAALALPSHVIEAYQALNNALGLGEGGPAAAPGDDREPFDPQRSFQVAQAESLAAGFGGFDWGGLLSPLRQLSFWTMKKRARNVGEKGMHDLVKGLQDACAARAHLMGHSFGCIVVSSILGGLNASHALPRPVDSVVLVQGALSLWAYAPDIPKVPGKPGYFSELLKGQAVRGPIVTTQSRHDRAVGTFYPIAAGVAGQVDFGPDAAAMPLYGGLGTFGICGVPSGVVNQKMRAPITDYDFKPGTIYNLDASEYIRKGGGASGAHSDIDGAAVAHAIWQAAAAGASTPAKPPVSRGSGPARV